MCPQHIRRHCNVGYLLNTAIARNVSSRTLNQCLKKFLTFWVIVMEPLCIRYSFECHHRTYMKCQMWPATDDVSKVFFWVVTLKICSYFIISGKKQTNKNWLYIRVQQQMCCPSFLGWSDETGTHSNSKKSIAYISTNKYISNLYTLNIAPETLLSVLLSQTGLGLADVPRSVETPPCSASGWPFSLQARPWKHPVARVDCRHSFYLEGL